MNIRAIITTTAVGALALSACGSSGGAPAATVPAKVGLEVDAGPGIRFGAESYTASAGKVTVALVNRDSQLHSLVFVDSNNKTLPGQLEVGKAGDVDSRQYDFAPGTYRLLCLVPGHDNMKATLEVK